MATGRGRVLVVDDDAVASKALARLLSSEGFEVESAANASEALELAARTRPDIVVTDLRMPGMGGVALLEALRGRGFELPVIVATGCDQITSAVTAIRAGAADYLIKPIDADVLVLAIDRALATWDLRRDAAALRARNEELAVEAETNLRAREELLSIVAHDIRGPLGIITLAAETVLLDDRLNPDATRRVQMIQRAGKSMSNLVEDLLDFGRIQGGHLVLELGNHHVSGIIQDVVAMHEPLAQERGIRIAVAVGDFELRCASERLVQVLGNLVSNALRLSPPNSAIRLRAELRGEHAWFAVEDEGPGIPSEELALVFQRSWRENKARRQGAGLGLSIAKGIVEAHGGTLGIESRVGAGSTFHFAIPLHGLARGSWSVGAPEPERVPA